MNSEVASIRRVVIIGASHAGLAVATTLRNSGFDGEIVLLGSESTLPYQRPQLSKESLFENSPPRAIRPETFFLDQKIELCTGALVIEVDPSKKIVSCADGTNISYDVLVFATGAQGRKLPKTIDPNSVALTLRDQFDWSHLSPRLRDSKSLVIIGGGLIGLEVAATARDLGLSVTVIEAAAQLMARSLYSELAVRVLSIHQTNGIKFYLNTAVQEVTSTGVNLSDGATVNGDVVLSAIGSVAQTDLAKTVGLDCSDGIETNATGRTSDPAIYALGDCALWNDGNGPVRHESIAATQAQAKALSAEILEQAPPFQAPLRLWSTQGKTRLQMSGPVLPESTIDIEDITGGGLLLRAFKSEKLIAVQSLDAPRQFNAAVAELVQANKN